MDKQLIAEKSKLEAEYKKLTDFDPIKAQYVPNQTEQYERIIRNKIRGEADSVVIDKQKLFAEVRVSILDPLIKNKY